MKKKYPRTKHLPYSEKKGDDDKTLEDDSHFKGVDVTAYIKLDGENTSVNRDYIHARSLDSTLDTEDRKWIDALRTTRLQKLPPEATICGENMFYKHTVEYGVLKSPFYMFSVWEHGKNRCYSVSITKVVSNKFDIPIPDVIYSGIYDKDLIMAAFAEYKKTSPVEGFVVRVTEGFKSEDWDKSVAKFVSSDFRIPGEHWRKSKLIINKFEGVTSPWELLSKTCEEK